MPKMPKEPNTEKGKHFVFYKRNPVIFASSNHLVSVGIAVVKLNPTRFASMTIYMNPFRETRLRRHKNPSCQKHQRNLTLKRVSIWYFTKEIPTVIFASSNHLVFIGIAVIKLNQTRFASVSTYLYPFQETRHRKIRHQKIRHQKHRKH